MKQIKHHVVFTVSLCLFITTNFSIIAQPAYEALWASLLTKHSTTKQIKGHPYTIIHVDTLKNSQSFQALNRYINTINPKTLSEDEQITLFINKYNIQNITNPNQVPPPKNTQEHQWFNTDPRLYFARGGPQENTPNIIAFSSKTLNNQLTTAMAIQLKKSITLDTTTHTLKTTHWLNQRIPSQAILLKLIQTVFPEINLQDYSIHNNTTLTP